MEGALSVTLSIDTYCFLGCNILILFGPNTNKRKASLNFKNSLHTSLIEAKTLPSSKWYGTTLHCWILTKLVPALYCREDPFIHIMITDLSVTEMKSSLTHLIFLILVPLIFPFSLFYFNFFLLNRGCLFQEQRRLEPWRIFLRLRAVSLHHSFSFKSNPKQASGEAASRDKPWA